jgi:PTS system mannose-specific IIC component
MGYMPVKKYFEYILFGFVMYAYLGVPVLGIAIVAVGLAWMLYKNLAKEPLAAVAAGNGDVIGGDEDE